MEEELETNQPLVVNTVPVLDIQPNRDNLEREESVLVQGFLSEGCGCDLANGSCSSTFTAESLESYRSRSKELSRAELDMAILGQLSASTNISTLSVHSTQYRHAATARKHISLSSIPPLTEVNPLDHYKNGCALRTSDLGQSARVSVVSLM